MALFSFGKKDKNPPEPPVAVAKPSPRPPQIQTPPASGSVPTIRPPQLSGLMPSAGMATGAVTTQPMVMPRSASAPTKLSPTVAQPTRSTQRIALSAAAGKGGNTRTISAVTGRINLPIGMILRCLPPEALAADLASLEGSGAAATEVGLPMNTVLNQLPSGKVEMTLQEIVPHMPPGYLKPTEALTPLLSNLVNLPLMDVVMRIPPDLLALRPDQKDVDSSVTNMADPFTEEILREQAEATRLKGLAGASQAKIIDENQVPATEEFVPRDQVSSTKSFIPPIRPLAGSTIGKTSGLGLGIASLQPAQAPQLPSSGGVRTTVIPPMPGLVRNSSPVPPPAPNSSSRRISPSGRLPTPVRASSPLPMRPQVAPTSPVNPPLPGTAGLPSLAPPFVGASDRPTTPLPTPLPRIGASAPSPQVPQPPLRPTVAVLPMATPEMPTALPVETAQPVEIPAGPVPEKPVEAVEVPPAFPLPGQPDAAAAELQRLAALAMQQAAESSAPEISAATSGTVTGIVENSSEAVKGNQPDSIAAEAPPLPSPPTEGSSTASLARFVASRSISAPVTTVDSAAETVSKKEPEAAVATTQPALALNLNNCGVTDLIKIPGCSSGLADSIVKHRARIGSFKKLEDLLEVPGMNNSAYRNLTGEEPPQSGIPLSISELLGFPEEQKVTLKDVTDRICCWPDVTGCILGQSTGLSLVGTVPKNLDKAAIVAFAPRMFESINKSFGEITGKETNELVIPTPGTSFHIMRNGDLYLIILSRLPQMPDRHVKIARLVLAGLNLLPV